ncbi:hypothetical protein METBIDRAFT_33117 [Metschnikowia bicuspidata var. bicuspidata NRRL YB-4993]|uniref:Uncharacterized protein n=1 Tax=Metschnikowia bicuspidata var. bicuspidata NRRL YB-4993 TaxID=869754 RepID=A0A1A0H5R0_9ASCO|nr:hypothetical protein METBIDRAFT_33117 [Metschnikowia bicuspidata var. bicuspidata NRRL YB-4993]OBA19424.1 hypothetical protein METBIDRAFT_33117 [Metschnikowia bicuspidata var. bicuspidata NRRL YB-4993]
MSSSQKAESPRPFLPTRRHSNFEDQKSYHADLKSTLRLEQSSLCESLEKEKPHERKSSKSSESLSYTNSLTSPLPTPEEYISETIEIPIHKAYSETIVSQMLLLRFEQEKTKQIKSKIELGQIVAQLLKECEAHAISTQLIHRLFSDDNDEIIKNNVEKLTQQFASGNTPKSSGEEIKTSETNKMNDIVSKPSHEITNPMNSLSNHPQASIQENLLHTSSIDITLFTKKHPESNPTPLGDQNELLKSQKTVSDPQPRNYTEISSSETKEEALEVTQTLLTMGSKNQSERPVMAQPILPLYYRKHSRYLLPQVASGSQPSHIPELGLLLLCHNHSKIGFDSSSQYLKNGMLYREKYSQQTLLLMNSSSQQRNYEHQGQQFQQQIRPLYHVESLVPGVVPSTGNIATLLLPPPFTVGAGTHLQLWAATPLNPQTRRRRLEEDTHTQRKRRGSKNGIVFMISTPKNPPAQKYSRSSGSS